MLEKKIHADVPGIETSHGSWTEPDSIDHSTYAPHFQRVSINGEVSGGVSIQVRLMFDAFDIVNLFLIPY